GDASNRKRSRPPSGLWKRSRFGQSRIRLISSRINCPFGLNVMPQIPFSVRIIPFVTELGIPIAARRLFVEAHFVASHGGPLAYQTFFDTGSPYSVVPFTLSTRVTWRSLGRQSFFAGKSRPLEWHGLPCEMGEAEVQLVNTWSGLRSRPLRM